MYKYSIMSIILSNQLGRERGLYMDEILQASYTPRREEQHLGR